MSTELTIVNPGALMTQATDVAGVCAEIVKRTAVTIQGRKYVKAEGWQSIAAAYGCVASSVNVERVTGGVRATGELHRVSDGALIATASGFVGEDEPTWYGGEITSYGKIKVLPKRPDFAIQAMAQTRAISRVCRSAFAFVVVLIDANLSTTPAEEMMGVVHEQDAAPQAPATVRPGERQDIATPAPAAPDEDFTAQMDAAEAREREAQSKKLLDSYSLRFDNAKDSKALKAIGREITPEIKAQMIESHRAMLRENYLHREAQLAPNAAKVI